VPLLRRRIGLETKTHPQVSILRQSTAHDAQFPRCVHYAPLSQASAGFPRFPKQWAFLSLD
jgi:hypothetical protein